MNVPDWLGHLRTDDRSRPVPYVNLWGPEDVARVSIAYDRNVRGRAVYLDDSEQTVPDFTRQNMQRQRECMAAGLCQVCGRHIPWSQRTLVLAALSVQTVEVQGRPMAVIHEPWLHQRCADFAVTHCPALIRRTRDERLEILPIRAQREVTLIRSTGWIEGPLEAETKADPVTMWLKLALRSYRLKVVSPSR